MFFEIDEHTSEQKNQQFFKKLLTDAKKCVINNS
jgi:hypothetical protein